MKSDKSPLKKAVKAVTKSIRESSAAVAAKLKKSKTSASEKAAAAQPESKAPSAAEEPPLVRKRATKTPASAAGTAASTSAKPKKKAAVKPAKTPEVPAILLEGDRPSAPAPGGPGQRYSLGPTPPPEHVGAVEEAELPEAYGTKRLFLAARDPHWLYARWDLTREQQNQYNRQSVDRHLVLRIFLNAAGDGEPQSQVHVHPESTHWFCHVPDAGAKYVAQLGFYSAAGDWTTISTSAATLTPPDEMSEDLTAEFATIPVEVPFAHIKELAQAAVRENVPLTEVLRELRASGHHIPETKGAGKWTPERERALAAIITMDRVRRVWMGSVEITELIRRQLQQEISSMGVAQFSQPSSPFGAITSVSSPFGGGEERQKGFWFNVNAELIIYGATEPDAQVTIGGRVIKLRPDGSFSYRFALPDGQYELPAVAVSSDQTDARAAELRFGRSTEYRGDVGKHPQDPQLKAPLAENVA